jgi:hypothetical protein
MSKVLVELTGKSRDRLMMDGGTSEWVLNPAVVRGFDYVVCVRHANPPYDPGAGARPEPHGAAFLVGKIADLELTSHDKGRDRYLVKFSAVADVLVRDFWDGSRNPVRYMDAADVAARGIDFDALDFEPFGGAPASSVGLRPASEASCVAPLSILEAKEGLAAKFGVPVEMIEITIKG